MKILFVANKYFSRYKYYCVALKSHKTKSFDFIEKSSIVKPDLRWANICNFTELFIPTKVKFMIFAALKKKVLETRC